METPDHYERADFDAEEKTVRKFTQTRTTHISKDHLELVRIFLQSENSCFNFFAKNASQGRDAWTRTNLEPPRVRFARLA